MNIKEAEDKVIDGEYEPIDATDKVYHITGPRLLSTAASSSGLMPEPKTCVVATPFRYFPPIDEHDIEVIRPSKKGKGKK